MMEQIIKRMRTAAGRLGFVSGWAWRGHPIDSGYHDTGVERVG